MSEFEHKLFAWVLGAWIVTLGLGFPAVIIIAILKWLTVLP